MRRLALIGLLLLALVLTEDHLLPRLEGSAARSLLDAGPWALAPLGGLGPATLPPAAPVFLGLALLAGLGTLSLLGLAIGARLAQPPGRRALVQVLLVTAGLTLALVVAPPTENADLAFYAFQGRMIVRYHQNPDIVAPRQLAADPWYPLLSPTWRDLPAAYGPAWLLLASGVDAAADHGGGIGAAVATMLGLRALLAALTLANVVLIWQILGVLAPERQLVGTLAYAWNPVVALVGAEHNDTAMLFFALVGLWLMTRRRFTLAAAALALSALVKYYTAPLLLAYLIWRGRAAPATRSDRLGPPAAALVVSLLVFLPFDPPALAAAFPQYLVRSGRLGHLDQLPFELLLALGGLVGVRLAETRTRRQVLQHGLLALIVYLACWSRDWFPWYLVSTVGLSALLGGWWLDTAAAASVLWLLALHGGEPYLAGLAQAALRWSPATTAAVLAVGLVAGVAALSGLWHGRGWPRPPLQVGAGVVLLAGTAAAEVPLVQHWTAPPPSVALDVAPAAGPVVFGTVLEWQDWSWGVVPDEVGTPAGPGGPRSLCLAFPTTGGGFYAHDAAFATRGYQALTLLVGPSRGQLAGLALSLRGTNGQILGTVALGKYPGQPSAGGWRRVRVPLAALGGTDATVTGVVLQSQSPGPTSVCLQAVAFQK